VGILMAASIVLFMLFIFLGLISGYFIHAANIPILNQITDYFYDIFYDIYLLFSSKLVTLTPVGYSELVSFFLLLIGIMLPGLFTLLLYNLAIKNVISKFFNLFLFILVVSSFFLFDIFTSIIALIFSTILYFVFKFIGNSIVQLLLSFFLTIFSLNYIKSILGDSETITNFSNDFSALFSILDYTIIFYLVYFFALAPFVLLLLNILGLGDEENKESK
jgi:hypothetical protein